MNGFVNFLLHFIFIVSFFLVFFVTVIIVRPLREHKERPVSTILFKLSYLGYLLIFILLTYLVLFFSGGNDEGNTITSNIYRIYYLVVGISFLVPNLSMMFRRKVKKLRRLYNVLFTAINILIILVLIYIIYAVNWSV